MADNARKYTLEMVGEAFRDIGILVLVFVPLDAMFAEHPLGWKMWSVSLAIGVAALAAGIGFERRRKL